MIIGNAFMSRCYSLVRKMLKRENNGLSQELSITLARMANILYAAKIYAFSEYLGYDKNMIQKLHRFCLFTSLFHVKVRLTSSNAIDAPINDLQFWKNMQMFKKLTQE